VSGKATRRASPVAKLPLQSAAVTDNVWTVQRLLEWTAPFFTRKGVDSPRLCAELLLAHVLGIPRIKLYTDYQRALTPDELAKYRDLVRRAGEDEPVAYLTGNAHFFNLELDVTPDVLIPRPDTEVLVEQAISVARSQPDWQPLHVLDLCTGSGCVAAAIAANLKTARVWAVEISPAALAVAGRNIQKLGLADRTTLTQGDLYAPVDGQQFHLILANPPYIRSGQIASLDKSVKDYEPIAALDGGADGLAIHRRIWAGAADRLVGGGHLLLEIAFDQGPAALAVLAEYPALANGRILKDHAGNDRVVAAKRA
jgi:release factor glutamine methyltransferase